MTLTKPKPTAFGDDDSFLLSQMRAEYHLSASGCDDLCEAEFAGLAQNLTHLQELRMRPLAELMIALMRTR